MPNRRVSATVGDTGTDFVLDGREEIEERTATRGLVRSFVHGPRIDELLALDVPLEGPAGSLPPPLDIILPLQPPASTRYYYHQDEQMTVIALTDSAGVPVEAYRYDPYGKITYLFPGPNGVVEWGGDDLTTTLATVGLLGDLYKFTGRRHDPETGFNYYRSRYMSSEMGRFISSDTIGVWGDANNLGNPHIYCGQNPHDCTDPSGKWGWKKGVALAAVIVVVAAVTVATGGVGGIAAMAAAGSAVGAVAGGGIQLANECGHGECLSVAGLGRIATATLGGALVGAAVGGAVGAAVAAGASVATVAAVGSAAGGISASASNALEQGINVATGLQCDFDEGAWAANTVAGFIGGGLGAGAAAYGAEIQGLAWAATKEGFKEAGKHIHQYAAEVSVSSSSASVGLSAAATAFTGGKDC
jgi:RHS repeat-associated protein